MAVVKLSRRRAWHSSWIRIALNCPAVIVSAIPSGRSKTGRTIPNTAGSTNSFEDITRTGTALIGRSILSGHAALTALRIRHHERTHNETETTKPHSHRDHKITGIGFTLDGGAGKIVVGMTTKGMLISATAEIGRSAITGGVRHSNRWPIFISNEKGIRNFNAAVNHKQYRTRAAFFRKWSANNAATATTRVDCQRWFAKGDRYSGIIWLCPFRDARATSPRPLSHPPS